MSQVRIYVCIYIIKKAPDALHPSGCRFTIVSGGQTGADRAALDRALAHGVECGGWCPKGRKAEDGPIDPFCDEYSR
jgi:Circularly permutated YpsA SLOG family